MEFTDAQLDLLNSIKDPYVPSVELQNRLRYDIKEGIYLRLCQMLGKEINNFEDYQFVANVYYQNSSYWREHPLHNIHTHPELFI